MFSFHKPKIYRSISGCCICKAKSSSSRFTDSNKYEAEFAQCFRIAVDEHESRRGEICNACVLLVKRWKKLPSESRRVRHWHHVVDARAGPALKFANMGRGSKAATRRHFASAKTSVQSSNQNSDQRSLGSPPTQPSARTPTTSSTAPSSTAALSFEGTRRAVAARAAAAAATAAAAEAASRTSSTTVFGLGLSGDRYADQCQLSSAHSSAFDEVILRFRQRRAAEQQRRAKRLVAEPPSRLTTRIHSDSTPGTTRPLTNPPPLSRPTTSPFAACPAPRRRVPSELLTIDGFDVSSVLDVSLWRMERRCCGVLFRGLNNELAVFPKLFKPSQCPLHCNPSASLATKRALAATNFASSPLASFGAEISSSNSNSNLNSNPNSSTDDSSSDVPTTSATSGDDKEDEMSSSVSSTVALADDKDFFDTPQHDERSVAAHLSLA